VILLGERLSPAGYAAAGLLAVALALALAPRKRGRDPAVGLSTA
jgi:hypothetical protein